MSASGEDGVPAAVPPRVRLAGEGAEVRTETEEGATARIDPAVGTEGRTFDWALALNLLRQEDERWLQRLYFWAFTF